MYLCGDLPPGSLEEVLGRYGVNVAWVGDGEDIPGSHWDAPEAGMIRGRLYVRADTPVHSALHEGGHLVCMGPDRRRTVHTDAGGDDLEESAVCYLQILLAGELAVGSARLMRDMDDWGYSFRLGSTKRWFEEDAEDAREWLDAQGLTRGGVLLARSVS